MVRADSRDKIAEARMTLACVANSAIRGPVNHGVLQSGLVGDDQAPKAPEEIFHEVLGNEYQVLGRRRTLSYASSYQGNRRFKNLAANAPDDAKRQWLRAFCFNAAAISRSVFDSTLALSMPATSLS